MVLCAGLHGWAGTRKVKTNLDFTEARDSEWQWHQLGHMQICTSPKTDNHASTPNQLEMKYHAHDHPWDGGMPHAKFVKVCWEMWLVSRNNTHTDSALYTRRAFTVHIIRSFSKSIIVNSLTAEWHCVFNFYRTTTATHLYAVPLTLSPLKT